MSVNGKSVTTFHNTSAGVLHGRAWKLRAKGSPSVIMGCLVAPVKKPGEKGGSQGEGAWAYGREQTLRGWEKRRGLWELRIVRNDQGWVPAELVLSVGNGLQGAEGSLVELIIKSGRRRRSLSVQENKSVQLLAKNERALQKKDTELCLQGRNGKDSMVSPGNGGRGREKRTWGGTNKGGRENENRKGWSKSSARNQLKSLTCRKGIFPTGVEGKELERVGRPAQDQPRKGSIMMSA